MESPFATNILITGGAGFLGRGILRYIQRNGIPASITVYSRNEHNQHALRSLFPNLRLRTSLGDIRDIDHLTAVMSGHDVVIHAAAMKHIPEAERDVAEAVTVNITGSQAVVWAALRAGVRQVVGVSTDKACSPRNVYGATKMLMERMFQEATRLSASSTRFSLVRYGNVVSSSGSVIPIFREQLKRDGSVAITDLSMTRFWASVDDAVRLIERSLVDPRLSPPGRVYVYRCMAMKILSVAQAVWELDGGKGDVPFRVMGLRPGEKLHETLVEEHEARYATEDGPYTIIPQALSQTGEGGMGKPYSSDAPERWLYPGEMVEMIRDAEELV